MGEQALPISSDEWMKEENSKRTHIRLLSVIVQKKKCPLCLSQFETWHENRQVFREFLILCILTKTSVIGDKLYTPASLKIMIIFPCAVC